MTRYGYAVRFVSIDAAGTVRSRATLRRYNALYVGGDDPEPPCIGRVEGFERAWNAYHPDGRLCAAEVTTRRMAGAALLRWYTRAKSA